MENKDILDEQQPSAAQQPDNLTTDDAVTVNGGSADQTIDPEPAATQTPDPTAADTSDRDTSDRDSAPAEATDNGKQEVAELKDRYLRLYADFENFRRRTAKEKLDLIGNANESLLLALVPVVDDFERAMQSIENTNDVAALKEGVQLIYNKLYKTLEAKGLKPMTAKGEPFNADLHESVTQFPAPSDELKGKVIDEIEKGYYLNDKVIRFAKVIVGS